MTQPARTTHPVKAPESVVEIMRLEAYPAGVPLTDYLDALVGGADAQELRKGSTYLTPRTDAHVAMKALAKSLGRSMWDVWLELHLKRIAERRERLKDAGKTLIVLLDRMDLNGLEICIMAGVDPAKMVERAAAIDELLELIDMGRL